MSNAAATPSIPHAEFRERRERLLAELGGWLSVASVVSPRSHASGSAA